MPALDTTELAPALAKSAWGDDVAAGPERDRLNEIGYMLIRAGSNDAVIVLRRSDCELLGLSPGDPNDPDDHVEVKRYWVESQDGASVTKSGKRSLLKCEAEVLGDGKIRSCNVHVGTARAALEVRLAGRPITGLRTPDIQAPTPIEQPVA